jgi:transcriptional regulator with XRE-family HTH domain
MKETIGEKIKRLRKEKVLTQENVHNNQSQISQIESGRITNPDENTLLLIAKNMEIPFDELISDTTWVKPEAASISKEIAISPNEIDVEIDGKGNIDWSYRQYPLYNDKGEKREFCPKSGVKLILECSNCKRQVEESGQIYCFGCGKKLLPEHTIDIRLMDCVPPYAWLDFTECGTAIQEMTEFKMEKEKLLSNAGKKNLEIETKKQMSKDENWKKINENQQAEILAKTLRNYESMQRFNIQIASALEKKLRNTYETLSSGQIEQTEEDIKKELMGSIAFKIQTALTDDNPIRKALGQPPREIPSLKTMMEMLKDLSTTDDSDELIEKLQSKIDLNTETDENSNNENISEDGNSETAAENKTEQDSNNANNKEDKESNND